MTTAKHSLGRMAPGDLDETIGDTPRPSKEVYDAIVKSTALKAIIEKAVASAKPEHGIGMPFSQQVRTGIINQLQGKPADAMPG